MHIIQIEVKYKIDSDSAN